MYTSLWKRRAELLQIPSYSFKLQTLPDITTWKNNNHNLHFLIKEIRKNNIHSNISNSAATAAVQNTDLSSKERWLVVLDFRKYSIGLIFDKSFLYF